MSSVAEQPVYPEWDRVQRTALWAALGGVMAFVAIGAILLLAGVVRGALQFFLSYLVAFNFWLSIGLGCLVILMIQYCTGGMWGLLLGVPVVVVIKVVAERVEGMEIVAELLGE